MKLSGHSYNNDVFKSLLNGLSADVVYTKTAERKDENQVTGLEVFSSVGPEEFRGVQEEELSAIAGELQFAADKAKVALSQDDLLVFASQSIREGLRGKTLERAAQKYCNQIHRKVAPPLGDTRNSFSPWLLENANNSAVVPAGYNVQHGQNETKSGGYLGMSKNPNTIWDSDKLTEAAQTMTNDERIKANKETQEKFAADQKQKYWEAIQTKMGDPGVIQEKSASVANVATKEKIGDQKLPDNSMSIFSDNRDFENVPQQTPGETIKESSEERSLKKSAAKEDWNKSLPAKKVDVRSAVDKLFEGLVEGQ